MPTVLVNFVGGPLAGNCRRVPFYRALNGPGPRFRAWSWLYTFRRTGVGEAGGYYEAVRYA